MEARMATFENPNLGFKPLFEPLPGDVPAHVDGALKAGQLRTSALPNGIRIATFSNAHPVAAVGLFVDSGSRYETPKNSGVSYFFKQFGVSETSGINSELRLTRVLEGMNANYQAVTGREQIYYSAELGADHVESFVPILFDVVNPELNEYEVIDKRHPIEREVHDIESNPRKLIYEILHQEAYRNTGLGQSLYPPIYNITHITHTDLEQFHASTFSPSRFVLVGTGGVEHEKLVKIAADFAGDLPANAGIPKPASPYIGGEVRLAGDHETHLLLGFHGASIANPADFYAHAVLQQLLGGGRKFFKEGLGRSVSRLNKAVERNEYLEEATAFNFNYSDSGLFGVFGVAHPGHVPDLVKEFTSVLSGLKNVEAAELARAKQQFKASVHGTVESRTNLLEFIGTQVLARGKVTPPSEFADGVDAVTVDQVRAAAKKLVSSKPTLVAIGDIDRLPTLDQIQSSLQ